LTITSRAVRFRSEWIEESSARSRSTDDSGREQTMDKRIVRILPASICVAVVLAAISRSAAEGLPVSSAARSSSLSLHTNDAVRGELLSSLLSQATPTHAHGRADTPGAEHLEDVVFDDQSYTESTAGSCAPQNPGSYPWESAQYLRLLHHGMDFLAGQSQGASGDRPPSHSAPQAGLFEQVQVDKSQVSAHLIAVGPAYVPSHLIFGLFRPPRLQ
jgi:hypothetical protein